MYRNSDFSARSGRESKDMKLQDVFLNFCRREKIMVIIQLLDNTLKKGRIIGFDNHSIILQENNRQHLVYKSAAVAVNPQTEVNYIFNDSSRHDNQLIDQINEGPVTVVSDRGSEYAADFS